LRKKSTPPEKALEIFDLSEKAFSRAEFANFKAGTGIFLPLGKAYILMS